MVYDNYLENGNAKQISRDVQEYLLSGHIKNVRILRDLYISYVALRILHIVYSNTLIYHIHKGGVGTPAAWRLPDSDSQWSNHCHYGRHVVQPDGAQELMGRRQPGVSCCQ